MVELGLLLILCGLQLADAVTTYAFIRLEVGWEGNPFVRRLIRTIGLLPALVTVKAIALAPVLYFLDQPFMPKLLGIMIGFYLLVVFNNLRILVNAGRR